MCEESKDFCSSFTIKATEGQEGQKLAHHTEWEQSYSYNSNLLPSQPSVLMDPFSGMLVNV